MRGPGEPVSLDAYLATLRQIIEAALDRVLQDQDVPGALAAPLRYALLSPGKRLRPCLTLAVAETVGSVIGLDEGDARALALPGACAVEMIHTYSLVHDDLPSMDNDTLRRGRPTTHVVYGEGMGILAGDGLLTDAFSVLATRPSPATAPGAAQATSEQIVKAVAVLARAAGSQGMVGGQAIDLAAAGPEPGRARLDAGALEDMHLRKTGALIRAACVLGAVLTAGTATTLAAVDAYARDLGLAFQIVDDVLDVEGASGALGKTAGKDAAAHKPTFPALYGLEASKAMAVACVDRANATLAAHGLDGRLSDIANWTLRRTS
ncbi:MAG: polyprenyl synthetase family protein [Vicinamibacterales bacterium]